jgi:myosin-5
MLVRKRLTEQLRYGGVLEAVRVARLGYPVRLVHQQFFQRYRMLLPTVDDDVLPWSMDNGDRQKLCIKLVDCVLDEGMKHIAKLEASGGKLDPHEAGISRSEKIRRMQHQPHPISFPKTDVQLGNTKVFMRKPPHDALEAHRVFHQHAAATIIQSWMRGMREMRRFPHSWRCCHDRTEILSRVARDGNAGGFFESKLLGSFSPTISACNLSVAVMA